MAANGKTLEYLIKEGLVRISPENSDYIIIQSFTNPRGTQSTASQVSEYAVKISDFFAAVAGEVSADEVLFDPTVTSLLNAEDVQGAIDELSSQVAEVPEAVDVIFDNSSSGLAATNVQDAIDELATDLSQNTGLTTVVDISSAQILALGTTPVELLPDPGVGKYYDINQILFEMSAGATAYSGANQEDTILNVFGGFYGIVNDALLIAVFDSVATLRESVAQDLIDGVNSYYPKVQAHPIDAGQSNIVLSTYSGDDPTLGDGTLRVILEYKIRTFGS